MSPIKYPTGTMRNYQRKPLNNINRLWKKYNYATQHKRHYKYNNKKIYAYHRWFDSRSEVRYFTLLLNKHANFAYHHRYLLHPHTEFQYQGMTIKLQKRTYNPDFIIWKPYQSHDWQHPGRVIDIKGKKHVTVGANRQMDDFARKYHIPVIIARFDYKASRRAGMLIFNDQIRGTKKKFQEISPIF